MTEDGSTKKVTGDIGIGKIYIQEKKSTEKNGLVIGREGLRGKGVTMIIQKNLDY